MDRVGRVMEVFADKQLNLRTALFGYAEARLEPLIDRRIVIHRDERLEVCSFHFVGFGLAPGFKGIRKIAPRAKEQRSRNALGVCEAETGRSFPRCNRIRRRAAHPLEPLPRETQASCPAN